MERVLGGAAGLKKGAISSSNLSSDLQIFFVDFFKMTVFDAI